MRILLLTSKYNYGSLLQCYATKKVLVSLGYDCDFVTVDFYTNIFNKIFNKLKIKLHVKNNSLIEPESYYKNKVFNFEKQAFLKRELKEQVLSYKDIKAKIKNSYYDEILIGSDQVWNFNNQNKINKTQLQKFRCKKKLISFASSFGTNTILPKHKKVLKKYFKAFSFISVREKQSLEIFKNLHIFKKIEVLADPVVNLSADQWRATYNEKSKISYTNYVLIHFLGLPSSIALNKIKRYFLQNKDSIFILFLSDFNADFSFLKNKIFISGSPFDYLKLIDNANMIFTDSFHTSQFCIIFDKNFNVFDRVYQKGAANQNIRIEELIQKFDCKNSYIVNENDDTNNKPNYNLDFWRNKNIGYLKTVLPPIKKLKIKNFQSCIDCGLCALACKFDAINKNEKDQVFTHYFVDASKCKNCNLCSLLCYQENHKNIFKKEGYAAFFKNEIRKKSSSGGVFAALSKLILDKGGVVFGTKLVFDEDGCKNISSYIEDFTYIDELLGSKYVENKSLDSFIDVKKFLDDGRSVLFCSTSCKIDALYKYLGKNYDNLLTVDLICHGVPSTQIFNKYLDYLQKKYKAKIVNFKFRKKASGTDWNWKKNHVETITFLKNGKKFIKEIKIEKSPYYKLFLSGEIYREACYSCKFSSLDKPADITIGDYYEFENDYPDLFEKDKDIIKKGLNSVIVNTRKGSIFLKEANKFLHLIEVNVNKIQLSHDALCHPTFFTKARYDSLKIISRYGFSKFEKKEKIKLFFRKICNKIKTVLK